MVKVPVILFVSKVRMWILDKQLRNCLERGLLQICVHPSLFVFQILRKRMEIFESNFAYKLIVSTPKRMQSLTQKSLSVFEKSRKQIVTDGHSFVTAPIKNDNTRPKHQSTELCHLFSHVFRYRYAKRADLLGPHPLDYKHGVLRAQ